MANLDELGFTARYNKMEKIRQLYSIKGMTLIGMLITLFLVVYIGITIIRVIPVYVENYSIKDSIKGLTQLRDSSITEDDFANIEIIRSALIKRFEINGIYDIKPQQILVSPTKDKTYTIKINYNAIRPLFGNIELLFKFNIEEQVKINAQ